METQPKLPFSILDYLDSTDKNNLLRKAKYLYIEAGKFVEQTDSPGSLYIIVNGLISLRAKTANHFEFGQQIVGRSLEMKTLFNNAKTWEFAWCALEPTTLMVLPWKDFHELLSKNKVNLTYVRRLAISSEVQRFVRDLKAFSCKKNTITEVISRLTWYKDADFANKLKNQGHYFVILSFGSIELMGNAEGKEVAFGQVQNGEHLLLEVTPNIKLKFQPGTAGFIITPQDWNTFKCRQEFEFFLSLHGGVDYDDSATSQVFKTTKTNIFIPAREKAPSPFRWLLSPRSYLRSLRAKRYIAWAPDDTWLSDSCLSSLAKIYGHHIPIEATRSLFLSLYDSDILHCIQQVGLKFGGETEILKMSTPQHAPGIIIYKNRPVMYLGNYGQHVEIVDTNSMSIKLVSIKKLQKYWTGEVLIWKRKLSITHFARSTPVLKYFSFLSGSISSVALLFSSGLLSAILILATLLLNQYIFEHLTHETDRELIYKVLVGYIICSILAPLVGWVEKSVRSRLTWTLSAKVNSAYVQHIMRIPVAAFDMLGKGEVFNRLTDAKNLSDFLANESTKLFVNLASFATCFTVLYLYDPILCEVLAGIIPLIMIVTWILPSKVKQFSLRASQSKSIIKCRAINALENIETVKSNNALRAERWKVEAAMFREVGIKNQLARLAMYQEASVVILMEGAKLGSLYIGVLLFTRHEISMGMVVCTPFLMERALAPMIEIFHLLYKIPSYAATVQRLHTVFGLSAEKLELRKKASKLVQGDIQIANVSFSFQASGTKVLNDVSLHIKPGEVIAITGPSGSGKSSIVNMLTRFRTPNSGEIFLDHQNIKSFPLQQLRGIVGLQPQSGGIMRGTIAENISMFDKHATPEKIERAARIACAHEMIMSQTNGYATAMDTNGTGLSEGQSQLLCIARLVYADPSVFVLDETTAHIDAMTEENIFRSLLSTFKGRTFIIVTQKLNVLLKADRVVHLKGGGVVEIGTHSHLIREQGAYCNFVCKQICVNI